MKIQRFINESVNNPLLDEPWTMEKFNKIEKMKNQIRESDDHLHKLLTQYLLLNPDIQDEPTDLNQDETEVTWHKMVKDNAYYVFSFSYLPEYDDENEFSVSLNKKKFADLLEFLKDPEFYINAKKYNL